jgi:hypothetical protein
MTPPVVMAVQRTTMPHNSVVAWQTTTPRIAGVAQPSEVQSKMIFMGHQILSYHVPVVRSIFIFWKTLLSS